MAVAVLDEHVCNNAIVTFDYRSSLLRRLQAVHSLYHDACATMSLEQVNKVTTSGVLPIAFSLVHQVLIEDSTVVFAGGPMPQFDDAWAERIGLGVVDHGKERTVEDMMHQRIGDYDSFLTFQRQVFAATEDYVASVPVEAWDEIIVSYPYGPTVANTFSARVGAQRGISRSDALESWVYQHALRHMGEIEHARALVGLTGMTS